MTDSATEAAEHRGRNIILVGISVFVLNLLVVAGLAWYVQWDDTRDAKESTKRRENICNIAESGDIALINAFIQVTTPADASPERIDATQKAADFLRNATHDNYAACAAE